MRKAVPVLVLASLLLATAAKAEVPSLELNSRVRVSVTHTSQQADGTKRFEGELLGLTEETMTLETSSKKPPLVLQRQDVTEFEMRLHGSKKGRGALIGLAVGAGFGAIMGYSSGDDQGDLLALTAEGKALGLAILLAPIGALVGAAIAPGSRWMSIPPDRITIGYDYHRLGGPVVSVTLRF